MNDTLPDTIPSPLLPHGREALMERAKDLRWTWSHCTNGGQHVFVENIFLGDASPTMIRAELYANGDQGRDFGRQEMTQVQTEAIGPAGYIYRATVPSTRPVSDSTVRIVPHCTDLSVPLEAAWILWRK